MKSRQGTCGRIASGGPRNGSPGGVGTCMGALLLALLLSSACAPNTGRGPTPPPDPNVITREQIEASYYQNAYELVRALHGNWLNSRGNDTFQGTPTEVQVYVDDQRYGGPETLLGIPLSQVGEIRFIEGTAAAARWGLGHGAGVIHVLTLTRR